jgi:hypothetical protein
MNLLKYYLLILMNLLNNKQKNQQFCCPYCRSKTKCINIKKKYINKDEICCICLDYILSQNNIIQTKCNHIYHTKCLIKFINIKHIYYIIII